MGVLKSDHCDFSGAGRGTFHCTDAMNLPIYLDPQVREYLTARAKDKVSRSIDSSTTCSCAISIGDKPRTLTVSFGIKPWTADDESSSTSFHQPIEKVTAATRADS